MLLFMSCIVENGMSGVRIGYKESNVIIEYKVVKKFVLFVIIYLGKGN